MIYLVEDDESIRELIWKELRQVLKQKHISYKVVFTKYRGHAVKLAAALTEKTSPERTSWKIGRASCRERV